MTPSQFVSALEAVSLPSVFNPWRDRCPVHDVADAAARRRHNLESFLEAAIRAVETVDTQLSRVVEACRSSGTALLVSADHGNCEQMWDPETNGPHTAHTTNRVGIVLVEPEGRRTATTLADGALCDVAPTLLGLIGVPQPAEMTGRDLRRSESPS